MCTHTTPDITMRFRCQEPEHHYASYFLPSTLKLWNSLPPEIKDCINIFRKVNDFYRIHKTQIHHVIFYLECNVQFSFFFLLPLIFSYLNNVKWIEYVLITICNFSCGFFRKRINISVTLVSESYVILYCEKNVICNSSIKICLNQSLFGII